MRKRNISEELEQEILEKDDRLEPIAQELARKLTNLLSYHKLSAGDGLMLLARLSATYVHVLQTDIKDSKVRDGLEDCFITAYQTYLTNWDYNAEMEEEKERRREKMN